jgi:DNA-binding response OmpR family regulator
MRVRGVEFPVVVVSALPEIDKWLDALDAGADDYCAAPFDPRLLQNIVENALTTAVAC